MLRKVLQPLHRGTLLHRRLSARSLLLGSLLITCSALLLFGNLFAAPRVPSIIRPYQSCASGGCHTNIQRHQQLHPVTKKQQCTACHRLRRGRNYQKKRSYPHRFVMVSKEKMCVQCHKSYDYKHPQYKGWRFMHGPVVTKDCVVCHNPHGSNQKHFLRKPADQLCQNCHREVMRNNQLSKFPHKPVKEGKCTRCHQSHGSKQRYLLQKDPVQFCLSCHKKMKKKLANATIGHRAPWLGNGCLNCHYGHGSRFEKHLRNRADLLCLNCHNHKQRHISGKRYVRDVGRELQTHPYKHGPIQKGRCNGCHNPHGSRTHSLLKHTFSLSPYNRLSKKPYALCFSCHKSALIHQKETRSATKFRNGTDNLHYLHVNRKKSRSCSLCHQTHASIQPRLIRAKVKFGQWSFPIQFKVTKDGGSCLTACHAKKAYDRKHPVSYEPSAVKK